MFGRKILHICITYNLSMREWPRVSAIDAHKIIKFCRELTQRDVVLRQKFNYEMHLSDVTENSRHYHILAIRDNSLKP